MSQNENNEQVEVNLSEIPKTIKKMVTSLHTTWKSFLFFLFKKARIIIPLFILGTSLGYFIDKIPLSYQHEIIVYPNFESVDFLESKIQTLSTKLKQRDSVFLKEMGIDKRLYIYNVILTP